MAAALLWFFVRVFPKRALRVLEEEMAALIKLDEEVVIIKPERGTYCGGSGPFPDRRSDAVLALTKTSLWVSPLLVKAFEVPVSELKSQTTEGSPGAGPECELALIVTTRSGERIGLVVDDVKRWSKGLSKLRVHRVEADRSS